jgi:hypothetical protein
VNSDARRILKAVLPNLRVLSLGGAPSMWYGMLSYLSLVNFEKLENLSIKLLPAFVFVGWPGWENFDDFQALLRVAEFAVGQSSFFDMPFVA